MKTSWHLLGWIRDDMAAGPFCPLSNRAKDLQVPPLVSVVATAAKRRAGGICHRSHFSADWGIFHITCRISQKQLKDNSGKFLIWGAPAPAKEGSGSSAQSGKSSVRRIPQTAWVTTWLTTAAGEREKEILLVVWGPGVPWGRYCDLRYPSTGNRISTCLGFSVSPDLDPGPVIVWSLGLGTNRGPGWQVVPAWKEGGWWEGWTHVQVDWQG